MPRQVVVNEKMDKFTRIYSLALLVVALGVLVGVFWEQPIVSELNSLLKRNEVLSQYPYRFRVMKVENGVASMTTPRSAEFPTSLALPLLYPELRNEKTDSATFLESQQEMARVQGIAKNVVTKHEAITSVVWTLDTNWLRNNGINPDLLGATPGATK